jgi:hypothetical protein
MSQSQKSQEKKRSKENAIFFSASEERPSIDERTMKR